MAANKLKTKKANVEAKLFNPARCSSVRTINTFLQDAAAGGGRMPTAQGRNWKRRHQSVAGGGRRDIKRWRNVLRLRRPINGAAAAAIRSCLRDAGIKERARRRGQGNVRAARRIKRTTVVSRKCEESHHRRASGRNQRPARMSARAANDTGPSETYILLSQSLRSA